MLTNNFYQYLANLLSGQQDQGNVYIALGGGLDQWDQSLPVYDRAVSGLQNEIVRKLISSEDIAYLDEEDNPSDQATTKIQISTQFLPGEGEGSVRETGLFVGSATAESDSGELISYYMHPRLEKNETLTLSRSFLINLTPSESSGAQFVTRYLGNSNSQELHDLENQQASCQIDEIRFDHVIYFASLEQAQSMGYDACAYCFGRELSQR